jgi:hypothetical protein
LDGDARLLSTGVGGRGRDEGGMGGTERERGEGDKKKQTRDIGDRPGNGQDGTGRIDQTSIVEWINGGALRAEYCVGCVCCVVRSGLI